MGNVIDMESRRKKQVSEIDLDTFFVYSGGYRADASPEDLLQESIPFVEGSVMASNIPDVHLFLWKGGIIMGDLASEKGYTVGYFHRFILHLFDFEVQGEVLKYPEDDESKRLKIEVLDIGTTLDDNPKKSVFCHKGYLFESKEQQEKSLEILTRFFAGLNFKEESVLCWPDGRAVTSDEWTAYSVYDEDGKYNFEETSKIRDIYIEKFGWYRKDIIVKLGDCSLKIDDYLQKRIENGELIK